MNEVPIAIPVIVYAWVRTFGRVKSANAAKATEPTAPVPLQRRAQDQAVNIFGERATDATDGEKARALRSATGLRPQRSLAHPSGI